MLILACKRLPEARKYKLRPTQDKDLVLPCSSSLRRHSWLGQKVLRNIYIYIYIYMAPYLALGTRPWNVFGGCGSWPMQEHSLTCGVHGCIWPSLRNLEWKREREACRTAWEPGRLLGGSLSKIRSIQDTMQRPDFQLGEERKKWMTKLHYYE